MEKEKRERKEKKKRTEVAAERRRRRADVSTCQWGPHVLRDGPALLPFFFS